MDFYDEEIEIKSDIEEEEQQKEPKEIQSTGLNRRLNLLPTTQKQDLSLKENSLSKTNDSFESDSDLSKSDENKEPERLMSSAKWKTLNVPQDVKDCFQHILKYTPQTLDVEYHLQPFIPEFVPAVGDVDAFLKVSCPEVLDPLRFKEIKDLNKKLGLNLLDEPSGNQSEPSLLSMKLHSVISSARPPSVQVPVVKSNKDIDKWIKEIDEIHLHQANKRIAEIQPIANIDALMAEWPTEMEEALTKMGLPSFNLDCSLPDYTKMLCSLFDIKVENENQADYINAIHTVFTLYMAINSSLE